MANPEKEHKHPTKRAKTLLKHLKPHGIKEMMDEVVEDFFDEIKKDKPDENKRPE